MTGKTLGAGEAVAIDDHRVRTGAARREKTRQKLLSTAVTVFAERGTDAPSIDEFIAAAGVSRGTFYNHFKTTRELLDAVTAEVSDGIVEAIEQAVIGIESPVQRVASGCAMYMLVAIDHPAWGAFVTRTGIRGSASGHLVNAYLPRDLELARAQGHASFTTVRAARDLLLGSLGQGIESVLSGAAPREHLQEMLGLALRGIGVPAAQIPGLLATPLGAPVWPPMLQLLGSPPAD